MSSVASPEFLKTLEPSGLGSGSLPNSSSTTSGAASTAAISAASNDSFSQFTDVKQVYLVARNESGKGGHYGPEQPRIPT